MLLHNPEHFILCQQSSFLYFGRFQQHRLTLHLDYLVILFNGFGIVFYSVNIQSDSGTMTKQKRSLHVEVLPSAPVLSEAWEEVENPEFLLVREAPDKRGRNKRSSFNMERMREHLMKRDPGYVAWTSLTNNMDVLRGHLKEKLFVEVARRHEGGLGNIGRK